MTDLLYLNDIYLCKSTAKIVATTTLEDGRDTVVLDQTIFYPQGGGQPADHGTIISQEAEFNVSDVRFDADGDVIHIGSYTRESFKLDDQVTLYVDAQRRLINSRSHSAGHLVDSAVTVLALPLKPTKGYHFPEGAYVEYEGAVDDLVELTQILQKKVNELVQYDIPFRSYELSAEQAHQQAIVVPQGKLARIVEVEGFNSCGCGGTHVLSSKEIGSITIRKIKSKKGLTRISYVI